MKKRKAPVKRRREKGSDRLRHGQAGAPAKGVRAKKSDPRRHGSAQGAPTEGRPSASLKLSAGERRAVLRYAAELKCLGIDPWVLLLYEVRAEKAWSQLRDVEGLSVPGGLRALVASLWHLDFDALDAPSLRSELKVARAFRNHFGVSFPRRFRAALEPFRDDFDKFTAATDLDACAEALRLGPQRLPAPAAAQRQRTPWGCASHPDFASLFPTAFRLAIE